MQRYVAAIVTLVGLAARLCSHITSAALAAGGRETVLELFDRLHVNGRIVVLFESRRRAMSHASPPTEPVVSEPLVE